MKNPNTCYSNNNIIFIGNDKIVTGGVIGKPEIIAIFLGYIDTWKDGTPIKIKIFLGNKETLNNFLVDYLSMTLVTFRMHWYKKEWDGTVETPPEYISPPIHNLFYLLEETEGSISFINRFEKVNWNVKIIIQFY